MAKTMTPSAGQIDKAVANYRAMLEKHAAEFDPEAVQIVLGQSELAGEQFAVFRKRVEATSNLIVRRVAADRTHTPQAVLDATGRRQYTNSEVVTAMPGGGEGSEEVEVVFFRLGRYVSDAELGKEYDLRVLKPADPYALAAVNTAEPAFADKYPNATHWKDANDHWCFAAFHRRGDDARSVYVRCHDPDEAWSGVWWFAGLRK